MGLYSYYEFVFIIPLIYQLAFIVFFIIKERRTEKKPALSKGFTAGFLSLALICGVTTGWVFISRSQTVLPRNYGYEHGGGFASVDIYRYDVQNSENILPV